MCHDATALTGRRNPVRDAARLQTAPRRLSARAALLAVEPREILMVACHNFDLDAARGVGYRTAFVRRPDEWGPAGPPDPAPNPATDIVVGGFAELADHFGA